jgi:predicted dehydrogenase
MMKVGFIGGGLDSAIGSAHFAAINIDRKYSLDAGMFSIDESINLSSGEFYGVDKNRVYANISDFLRAEQKNLDAVIILSPTPLHFEHINQIFDAGIPVISEKALCTNSKDAQLLATRTENENRFLSVTFTYTGYPMVREIKRMISDGVLGDLLSVHVEMPQESFIRSSASGTKPQPQAWRQLDYEIPSVTLDLGTHVVNLLEFITGDYVARVAGIASHAGEVSALIDNVMTIGELHKGTPISLNWNKISLGKRNGLACTIYGSNGSISWEQENPEYLRYGSKDGAIQIIDRSHPMVSVASERRYQRFKMGHPAGYIEAFANLYLDIAADLTSHQAGRTFDNPYTHTAKDSLHGLQVLEALHESAAKKEWIEITSAP